MGTSGGNEYKWLLQLVLLKRVENGVSRLVRDVESREWYILRWEKQQHVFHIEETVPGKVENSRGRERIIAGAVSLKRGLEYIPHMGELAFDKSMNNFSMVTSGEAAYRHFCNNMINVLLNVSFSNSCTKNNRIYGKNTSQTILNLSNLGNGILSKTPINIVWKNGLTFLINKYTWPLNYPGVKGPYPHTAKPRL